MKVFSLFVIVLLSLFSTSVNVLEAATGFSLSPMFQTITLSDETSQEFSVTVSNDTTAVATFRLSVLDFGSLDESGGVAFLGAPSVLEKKYSLASWMHPETDTVTLAPGGTETVTVTIENRPDLSPGGHYAGLLFTYADEGDSPVDNNRIAVNQIFSVLVFVKKQGGELYGLELVEQTWERTIFSLSQKFQLRFKNTGNVHVVPRGHITLTDPLGRVVREGIVNEGSAIILPETFRGFPVILTEQAWAFLPGRYTLTLRYRHDDREGFTVVTDHLVFIPFPAMLSILILLGGGGWYAARRQRNTGERGSNSHSV